MGSRSLGELLLRPSSFARPSSCRTCIRQTAPTWTARRCISNTPNQGAAQPQKQEDDLSVDAQAPKHSPRSQRASNEQTSQAIDNLFSSPSSQRRNTARNQMSSGDELRAAQSNHLFGSAFSNGSSPRRSHGPPRLAFDDMLTPDSMLNPNLSNKPSEAAALATQQEETFANYPRLNPTYGRSISLDPSRGRDLVRGIGMLGSLVSRNRVKSDMNAQRFHERPGLKRKRLNSERWRRRFKVGFTHVTSRVSELTRKGW